MARSSPLVSSGTGLMKPTMERAEAGIVEVGDDVAGA
jgi:hypothetical protein